MTPMNRSSVGILTGLERKVVFSRLRAAAGLRWELPRLLAASDIPPGSLCLEVGGGLGWGTLGLIRHRVATRVVTTDYDGTVLPAARAYLGRHGVLHRVTLSQADARRLPFPDETFDVVLALYVLHHVFGYRRVLHELGRVTQPGGWFLLIDWVRPSRAPRLRKWFPPEGLPSQEELGQWLAEARFRVERWHGVPVWGFVAARKVG